MTIDTFLLALRKATARRELPRIVYSENAQTFKRAVRDLKHLHELLLKPEIKDFCATRHIAWKFIVERAPWWDGFRERMVGSVKMCP